MMDENKDYPETEENHNTIISADFKETEQTKRTDTEQNSLHSLPSDSSEVFSGAEGAEKAEPSSELNNVSERPAEPDARPDESEGLPVFHWSMASQWEAEQEEKKKSGRKGALIYAVIVTCLFILCFSILLGLLLFERSNANSGTGAHIERVVYVHDEPLQGEQLSVQEISSLVIPSTVGIKTVQSSGSSTGTGIIYSKDGYIITNYHVIEKQNEIKVITFDSREFPAEYIGGDEPSDIAVVKINPGDYELMPATFGNSLEVLVGDTVIAIGNAGGLELFGTVTKGVISGINRDIKFYDSNQLVEKRMNLIQTDANINPGNSGGPLVDLYGRVIGINFMKYVADEFEGLGFAIPINGALEIINSIIITGSYSGNAVAEKGVSLGISGTVVVRGEIISDLRITAEADGVMIVAIAGEDASAYGLLEVGDIIVSVNGNPISTVEEIRAVVEKCRVGDRITVTVVRNLTRSDIVITMK